MDMEWSPADLQCKLRERLRSEHIFCLFVCYVLCKKKNEKTIETILFMFTKWRPGKEFPKGDGEEQTGDRGGDETFLCLPFWIVLTFESYKI